MKRLPLPTYDHAAALAICLDGIGSQLLADRYAADFGDCSASETSYEQHARAASLFQIARTDAPGGEDPPIRNSLTRSDFTKLYTQYLVPDGKPGRTMYEQMKLTPNGKCPLCGDLGQVRTLDHYLPKSIFPLFSILPMNLVPSCRDCNTEKLTGFAHVAGGQTLHPFFDDDRFFARAWLTADVVPGEPPSLRYRVVAPPDWSAVDAERVSAHFLEYDLARRFAIEAGAELPETIVERRTISATLSPQAYAAQLREKAEVLMLPVNHWRRVMFRALAADPWFCNHRHPQPL